MSSRRVSTALVVGGLVIIAAAFNARAQEDFCGNNVKGPFEQCDGTDSSVCAAGCGPNCFCAPLCSPSPMEGCRQSAAGKGNLKIVNDFRGNSRIISLDWTWQYGDATSKSDFGNPTSVDGPFYAFCLYDGSPVHQPRVDSTISPGPAIWRESTQYFKYLDPNYQSSNEAIESHGIKLLKLTPNTQGKASIQLQARAFFFTPPVLPLALPVIGQLQLVRRDGRSPICWEVPYSTPTRNDGLEFISRGP